MNLCKGNTCSNICALEEDGPKCLCGDGSLAQKGVCPTLDKKDVSIVFLCSSNIRFEGTARPTSTTYSTRTNSSYASLEASIRTTWRRSVK